MIDNELLPIDITRLNLETQLEIKMEYFALFRSCTKKSEEILNLDTRDPKELYEQLSQRYRFPLSRDRIHLVVNDEYSPWDKLLNDGDRVVFIPPVSGG